MAARSLLSCFLAVSAPQLTQAAIIDTTGSELNLSLPAAWVGGVVPGPDDVANFTVGGEYVADSGDTFDWKGISVNAAGVNINPSSGGVAFTIILGADGISGTFPLDRMGQNITLNVGGRPGDGIPVTDQTWSVALPNFRPQMRGTSTITYTNPSRLLLRSNANFNFEGTWRADGGLIMPEQQTDWCGSDDQVVGELLNGGGLRLSHDKSYNRIAVELVGDGFLMATGNQTTDDGLASTLTTGAWDRHGDIWGSGNLTVTSNRNYGKLILDGDITHTGDTIVDDKPLGMTLELGSTSTYTFFPTTNNVSNQINGLDATNSKLIADGQFSIDRGGASLGNGFSWTLVDLGSLTGTFGPNFSVADFTEAPAGEWTLVDGDATWTFSESTGVLSLAFSGIPVNSSITTTGASFDMNLGTTWDGGTVPNNTVSEEFVPVFDEPGTYGAPASSVFSWYGIKIDADGTLELNPASGGNAYTINLGTGGISGTQNIDRLGANLTVGVGANDQTWSVRMSNVQAAITGTSTVTYTDPTRLWLRGPNFGFSGIWRADGGIIHPDGNGQWSGSGGATGQLLNDGAIRLSNSTYDRVRIEMLGNGRLLTSGANIDDGSSSTLDSGTGANTGDTFGTGDLTVSSNSNYGWIILNGDISHNGDTIIDDKSEGMSLDLETTSTLTFTLGGNGVSNQIRGLSATNSHLVANGQFIIDTTGAAIADGNSWTLVDYTNLDVIIDGGFDVLDFTLQGDGHTWVRTDGSNTWTFDHDTGVLSLASGASGFSSWITGTFANGTVPAGQQGAHDDPDGDGISNEMEYAVAGMDPTVPEGSVGTFDGMTLSFSKRQPLASDIVYAIEESTDLGVTDPWEEVPAGPSYVNNSTTISYALPGGPPKDFMRLKVTQP